MVYSLLALARAQPGKSQQPTGAVHLARGPMRDSNSNAEERFEHTVRSRELLFAESGTSRGETVDAFDAAQAGFS